MFMAMGREVREDREPGLEGRTGLGFRCFLKPVVQLSGMTILKQPTLSLWSEMSLTRGF